MKTCAKCNIEKPLSEFTRSDRCRDGYLGRCKPCIRDYKTEWRKTPKAKASQRRWKTANPLKLMVNTARQRARKAGVPCTITAEDIHVPDVCPVLGIPIIRANDGTPGNTPNSPSLDRIIPELGYVPGNVQVISQQANVMKNSASWQELLAFADWVYKNAPATEEVA